jgi:polar amino acid transport system substrate-binding protein
MLKHRLMFALLLLPATLCNAVPTIKLAMSNSNPPYVIAAENRGIVVDIAQRAFALGGYRLTIDYAPNRRVQQQLSSLQADGAFSSPCEASNLYPNAYYSAPIIAYQNVAVSLAAKHFNINGIGDLADKRIVAFQNAVGFLPPEFAALAKKNSSYSEVANQESQIDMLYGGRTDVIVLEKRIFEYFYRHSAYANLIDAQATTTKASNNRYVVHRLFPAVPYCAVFLDAKIRDIFNSGLQRLRNSGEYDSILHRYD